MAATGGGKIRTRRYHIASKPYSKGSQQSGLISRVTDTVKSIVPSWLQKYFRNGEAASGNGSEPVADQISRDPPTENSERGSPVMDGRGTPEPSTSGTEPSTSRSALNFQDVLARPPLSRSHLQFSSLDGSPAGPFIQPSTSSAPFPGGPFTQPSTSSTPFSGPPFTQPSTSITHFPGGPSGFSLVKEIKDTASQHEDDNISTTSGFSSRASDKDVTTSKPTPLPLLWSPENDRSHSGPQSTQPALKKPAFNLSVFGTSSASLMNNSALNSSQRGDSPFYPGKTTYGGAAAARSATRLRLSTPYQVPVRRQIKAKPAGAQACGVTSATARRILLSLERMSSPLADAKRIPSTVSSPLLTSLDRANLDDLSSQSKRKKVASPLPPVQRLTVPVVAAGNRLVSFRPSLTPSGSQSCVLDRRSVRDTPAGRSAVNAEVCEAPRGTGSSVYPMSSTPTANSNGGAGGKMRRERSTRPSSRRLDNEVAPDLELPAVSLPISTFSLPTFSFSSPPTTSSSATTAAPSASTPLTNKVVSATASPPFTFSSPIVKAAVSCSPMLSPSASGFTFSAPVLKSGPPNINGKATASQPVKSSTPGGPMDCDSEGFEGPFKPAKVLKSGSVLDIFRGPGFSSPPPAARSSPGPDMSVQGGNSAPGIGFGIRPPAGSWSCGTCLVQNGPSDNKCVACSTDSSLPSKGDGQAAQDGAPSSASLVALFAPPAGSWECDTCLVQNKPDMVKCVACETAKPGTGVKPSLTLMVFSEAQTPSNPSSSVSTSAASTPTVTTSSTTTVATPTPAPSGFLGFGNKFKKPEDSWECETCMVENKAQDSSCVACQSKKPGAAAAPCAPPTTASSTPTPVGGTLLGFGDKFKQPEGSWDCEVCLVLNKADALQCAACQSSKPGTSLPPKGFSGVSAPTSFTFGIQSSSSSSTNSTSSSTTTTSSLGGFKFGLATSAGLSGDFKFSTSSGGFKFGSSSAVKTEEGKKDEPQNTGGSFKFGISGGITFGSGATSSSGSDAKVPAEGFSFGLAKQEEKNSTAPTLGGATFTFSAPKGTSEIVSEPSSTETKPAAPFTFGKPAEAEPVKEPAPVASPFGLAAEKSQAVTSLAAPTVPGFRFGKTEEKPEAGVPPTGFLFSKTKESPTPSLGCFSMPDPTKDPPKPVFTFGKPAENSEAGEPPKPAFSFGVTSADSGASKSAFGFLAASTTALSSSSATPASSVSSTPPSGLFGASTTPTPAPSSTPAPFLFGQCISTEPAPTKTFVFGQQQESQPMQAAPQNPHTAPTPARPFIFGSGTNSTVPSFNFGAAAPSAGSSAAPSQSASPFAFSSAPASSATPVGSSFGLGQTPSFGQGSSQPSAPAFGSAAPSLFTASVSQPPAFGTQPSASPAPMFGQPASAAPAFGSGTGSSASVGGFQFGSSSAFGASGSSSTVFTFGGGSGGASSGPSTAPATQTLSSSGFNFGRPTFNIGSTKSPASASASGPHSISGRKIKTAVRRRK